MKLDQAPAPRCLFLRRIFGKVHGQRRNVFDAFAKTRDGKRNDVQPIVQITTEAALLHHRAKGGVGGGDDSDVDMDGPGLAQALELALLKNPQQLGLQVERHFANFVEQQVPPSASSNFPALAALAPVKAPLACPNSSLSSRCSGRAAQFTATNGLRLSVAAFMDKLRQQFLAGTTLGLDQYIGAGAGGSTGALQGLQQQGRTADNSRPGDCDGYVFSGKLSEAVLSLTRCMTRAAAAWSCSNDIGLVR
jgi:hypothetical protein